ncbi:MAG: hypothetical protein RI947_1045 [Candidatus Parcubacteria bacterium]|jgi:TrpR-related protein YerC/YecD
MTNIKRKQEFEQKERYTPANDKEQELVTAFSLLKNEEDAAHFLRDLMTPGEIEEFANRLRIAKQLMEGQPYLQIAHEVHTSTTTVTRVAHWLFSGCGGYYSVLKRLLRRTR